jgi:hypothetical protein
MAPGLAALLSGRDQSPPPLPRPGPAVVVPPKLKPARPARKAGPWPWVLAAGIVCGLLIAGYFYQDPIARNVPGAEDLYTMLGLRAEDPARLLEIGNLKSEQRSGLIALRGDIFNPKEAPLRIPPLQVIALDADKQPMGDPFWFRTKETDIAPGETITFRILYENAPKDMKSFIITFGKLNAKEP